MRYIIGLVGHPDTNKDVKAEILSHFDNVDVLDIEVTRDADIEQNKIRTDQLEKRCMGILFTDREIYQLFYSRTRLRANSAYLEDFKSEILITLFRAYRREDMDIGNISIDSIGYDEVRALYHELGLMEGEEPQILTIPFELSAMDSAERITAFHRENHRKFGSTCITFFTESRKRLEEEGIPVLKVGINRKELVDRVNELVSQRQLSSGTRGDRVAILIMLSGLKEHLILDNSEHNVLAEYNRISEAVFWFSEKIDGAYIPNDQRKYIIFCEKERYERETGFSSHIEVLNEISKKNYFLCHMGIGYGAGDREAIKNATIAQIRSAREKRSSAYIVYGRDDVIGPIIPSTEPHAGSPTIYDPRLNEIASRAQVSINTVYKLSGLVRRSGERDFTSRDIADHLGITVRSSNRLFSRLRESGYVKLVGEKSTGEKGRPIRIFRFLF